LKIESNKKKSIVVDISMINYLKFTIIHNKYAMLVEDKKNEKGIWGGGRIVTLLRVSNNEDPQWTMTIYIYIYFIKYNKKCK
jgi:hypothetical protein